MHSKQSFKPEEHCKLILDGLLLLELAEDQSEEAGNCFFLRDLNQGGLDDGRISLGDNPIKLVCIVRLQGLTEDISQGCARLGYLLVA